MQKLLPQPPIYGVDMQKYQAGFITLISVLILGAVGLAVATSLLLLGVDSSRTSLALEQSLQARGLADACAETALQQIRTNNAFVGTATLTFSTGSCTYTITNTGGTTRGIALSGAIDTIIRRVSITLSAVSPVTISLWQEVAS
jgi:hypothetical protein